MSKDAGGAYTALHALDIVTGAETGGVQEELSWSYPGTGDSSSNGNVLLEPGLLDHYFLLNETFSVFFFFFFFPPPPPPHISCCRYAFSC